MNVKSEMSVWFLVPVAEWWSTGVAAQFEDLHALGSSTMPAYLTILRAVAGVTFQRDRRPSGHRYRARHHDEPH